MERRITRKKEKGTFMDREQKIARHYLDTGILGAYETAEAMHEEEENGKYAPCFEDAILFFEDTQTTAVRSMCIEGRRYRICSVLPRGEILGGKPPYGYKRDESVRKGIVPNEETAEVVKRIFSLCAEGKGPNQIARILTKEQVLNPTNKNGRRSRWTSRTCSRGWFTVPTVERRWCSTGRIR